MTKKDYEKIAAVIFPHALKHNVGEIFHESWTACGREIAFDMARMLSQDNPRFDRARFLKACGIED